MPNIDQKWYGEMTETKWGVFKMTFIEQVFKISDSVKNDRTVLGVLGHTMSELGELAEEVTIDQGQSYKDPGDDGVIGEAIDTIICILDLIRITYPNITEQDLQQIAEIKLQKWVDKTNNKGGQNG